MPGMETKLHAVINRPGTYSGFSANYSGAGFSGMRFAFHGLSDEAFDQWVAQSKTASAALNRENYLELEKPSENEPVRHYASVDPDLYGAILNLCVERGKMCMNEMMSIDAKGGLGLAGVRNTLPLQYDKLARRGAVFGNDPSYVASICTAEEAAAAARAASDATQTDWPAKDLSPLRGAGLLRPGTESRRAEADTPSLGLLRREL
jgi:cytochrome o ubiquinol oxidase subunit 2